MSEHTVPGVVYVMPGHTEPANLFDYQGPLVAAAGEPIEYALFTDAASYGYHPVVMLGDLDVVACSWRNTLLTGADLIDGGAFLQTPDGQYRPADPKCLAASLNSQIRTALGEYDRSVPGLVLY